MVSTSIPKQEDESSAGRRQRRHYADDFARHLEKKVICSPSSALLESSNYTKSFECDEKELKGIPKFPRKSRKIYDPTIAPLVDLAMLNNNSISGTHPVMRDADLVLYKSTYQIGFNQEIRIQAQIPKFHYEAPASPITTHNKPSNSMYQTSYLNYSKMDLKPLGNPGKQFAIKNLLYRATGNGLTAKDLFLGIGTMKGITSYKSDYRPKEQFDRKKSIYGRRGDVVEDISDLK